MTSDTTGDDDWQHVLGDDYEGVIVVTGERGPDSRLFGSPDPDDQPTLAEIQELEDRLEDEIRSTGILDVSGYSSVLTKLPSAKRYYYATDSGTRHSDPSLQNKRIVEAVIDLEAGDDWQSQQGFPGIEGQDTRVFAVRYVPETGRIFTSFRVGDQVEFDEDGRYSDSE